MHERLVKIWAFDLCDLTFGFADLFQVQFSLFQVNALDCIVPITTLIPISSPFHSKLFVPVSGPNFRSHVLNPSEQCDFQTHYSVLMKVNIMNHASINHLTRGLFVGCFTKCRSQPQPPLLQSTSLLLMWMILKSLLCDLHPRGSESSAESLETRREWTEACIPHTTCTWREKMEKK